MRPQYYSTSTKCHAIYTEYLLRQKNIKSLSYRKHQSDVSGHS